MDAITQHHFHNIAYGKAKRMDNGDLATVNTIIKEIDGVETLIPTVLMVKLLMRKMLFILRYRAVLRGPPAQAKMR